MAVRLINNDHPVQDMNDLYEFQKTFAKLSGLATVIVNLYGDAITPYSNCSSFCTLIRQDEKYKDKCAQCAAHAGLEAGRNEKPLLYKCHAGLVEIAIPIKDEGIYTGSMIIGQVRINETAELLSFSEQSKWRNSQKLNHAFEKVPIMSKNELVQMAHLVKQAIEQSTYLINKRLNVQAIGVLSASFHHLIELINEEKYKESKNVLNKILKSLFRIRNKYVVKKVVEDLAEKLIRLCNNRGVTEVSYDFNHIAPFTYPNIKDFFHKMLDHLFLGMMAQTPCPSEKVIQRAINYIDIHYKRNITLSEVANFVHLNPHYLSRLFKQKLNQTFVNYITERRINHAKKLLKNTNIPIINIAMQLSFQDQSYFCKVFKKYTGMTPLEYRDTHLVV